ncbi:thiamine-phosphate kinase [archaeon]|nr:thiamine-phosphate kinase [archaeon]
MPKLYEIGERGMITEVRKLLRRPKALLTTLEEDAEIFKSNGTLAITTEMNNEGSHFRSRSPVCIARRVVVSTLSDLLAKGAEPLYMMTSVGLPKSLTYGFVETLYREMDSKLKEFDAFLIGGDTTSSNKINIATTAIGQIHNKPLLRSTAKTKDKIVLTGEIGNGALGYLMITHGIKGPEKFFRAQLEPNIDYSICKQLMKKANAGIDVSDGLAYQLHELAKQSKKKIVIDEAKLPVDRMVQTICEQQRFSLDDVVFHIGDDYQVVYTHPKPPCGHVIGEVKTGKGVYIKLTDGSLAPLENRGWESFKQ